MDNKPPIMKIKTEKLRPANIVLIVSFLLSIFAIVLQRWLQWVLFLSLPILMAAGIYEAYVRYKRIVIKESVAPDWNKVTIKKETAHDMSANRPDLSNVQMPDEN